MLGRADATAAGPPDAAAGPARDAPTADRAAALAAPDSPTPDQVFVRAIDLPTLSLRQARAAVAQQLDILSPLPPAEVAASVVLLGPTEEGLNRFAVGIAPRRLLARAADGPARAVTLTGDLDGQPIRFRFDRSARAEGPASWLEAATVAGMCLAIVLAGASWRLGREVDAMQARADDAGQQVQRLRGQAASVGRVAGAWRAAAASRKAGVVDCALADLAKAAGGPVKLARLTLADGQLTVRLAEAPSDAMAAGLRELGFTPVAAPAPAPADPAGPAAAPPAALEFRTDAGACR
ncbi:MAG TPA: hypothetical protein VGG29_12210 [Caulobacteraceae bacterium]